eukprot:SM000078S22038  [mRNA]  locus=s78:161994:165564:+ [translate_table: standard]
MAPPLRLPSAGPPRRALPLAACLAAAVALLASAARAEQGFCSGAGPAVQEVLASPTAASRLLIRGGTVVNAHGQLEADVYVEDGVISAVGPGLQVPEGTRIIDAAGKFVMPGGIDPHTHLDMPFMGTSTCDDFYSGQAAALAGGTTMHIDFAMPIDGDALKGFEEHRKKAKSAVMDYGFHIAVNGWSDKMSLDMEELVRQGVNSFKFFMAYKDTLQVTDEQLLAGFQKCKDLGAIPQVHAENGDAVVVGQRRMIDLGITGPEGHALSRPAVLEGEATARAIRLAKFVNVPLYVVHVMSIDALEEVAKARLAGQRVIGEPVVSGLVLDDSYIWDADFRKAAQYVMSPPIRGAEHGKALRAALAGGILQVVGTDHCPFNSSQKAMGRDDFRLIPNGVNGIAERMIITWDAMVIFNIYPQKGLIAPGSDADIIILDPNKTTTMWGVTLHSQMDTNIYAGWSMKGNIEVTVSQGKVVWEKGQLSVTEGAGRYIPMPTFGHLYDGLDKLDAELLELYRTPVSHTGRSPSNV